MSLGQFRIAPGGAEAPSPSGGAVGPSANAHSRFPLGHIARGIGIFRALTIAEFADYPK